MGKNADRLCKLHKELEDDEIDMFVDWILEGMRDIGFEHSDNCAMFRAHSHSADCDCGIDELNQKVIRILER